MKSKSTVHIVKSLTFVAMLLFAGEVLAQQHPERRHIREGNKAYEDQNYAAGETSYRRALEEDQFSYEAAFNLADALYRQGRFEESAEMFEELSELPFLDDQQRAKVFHNLGNTMFDMNALEDALEAYKMAQRFNPDDLETKYNLAYVKKLLEDDEQDDDGEGDDENNEDGEDQDNEGDNNDGDQEQDGEGDNEPDGNEEPGNDDQPEPEHTEPDRESNISREDAESILDAIQGQEDKTQEKMDEQRALTLPPSGKGW